MSAYADLLFSPPDPDCPLPPAPVNERPTVPPIPTIDLWGLPLAKMTFAETVDAVDCLIAAGEPRLFITANLHYAMLTSRDPRLADINRQAAFVLADGMPMVWWSRFRKRPLPERVTGSDLIFLLARRAAERGHRVYLLGGAPGVPETAAQNLQARYPGLTIAGAESPPVGAWSSEVEAAICARVRAARADLLFAALGQPRGELWLHENLSRLGVPACVQVGATLDFVAGRIRRAPRWMQRTGLEWAYRLLREPKRMGPRYLQDTLFLARAVLGDLLDRSR